MPTYVVNAIDKNSGAVFNYGPFDTLAAAREWAKGKFHPIYRLQFNRLRLPS